MDPTAPATGETPVTFNNAQRSYDARTPADRYDPTENMTPEEYAEAFMRWLDAGAPEQITYGAVPVIKSREDDVREWLVDFLNREAAR